RDELAALCMSGKQHSEGRRGFDHDRLPVATGSPQALRNPKSRMSLALQSLLPYPNSCLGASPHQQGRGTKMTVAHSITSLARATNASDKETPSNAAVFRLTAM